jgi:hypothetical protein
MSTVEWTPGKPADTSAGLLELSDRFIALTSPITSPVKWRSASTAPAAAPPTYTATTSVDNLGSSRIPRRPSTTNTPVGYPTPVHQPSLLDEDSNLMPLAEAQRILNFSSDLNWSGLDEPSWLHDTSFN